MVNGVSGLEPIADVEAAAEAKVPEKPRSDLAEVASWEANGMHRLAGLPFVLTSGLWSTWESRSFSSVSRRRSPLALSRVLLAELAIGDPKEICEASFTRADVEAVRLCISGVMARDSDE